MEQKVNSASPQPEGLCSRSHDVVTKLRLKPTSCEEHGYLFSGNELGTTFCLSITDAPPARAGTGRRAAIEALDSRGSGDGYVL